MRAAPLLLLLLAAARILLACTTTPTTTTTTPAATTTVPPPLFSAKPATSSLTVVHIGDSEAGLLGDLAEGTGGIAKTRAIIAALVQRASSSIVVHAGDTFIPAPELSLEVSKRSALLSGNDRLGVQAAAVGNHDFDLGESFTADAIKGAAFPYVSSTLLVSGGPLLPLVIEDASPWLHDPATRGHIVRRGKLCIGAIKDGKCEGGGVVGVVGASPEDLKVLTRGARNVSAPASTEATRDMLQGHIDALRKEGISVIVLLSHRQGVHRDLALIESGLVGVDVVVSGGGENLLASSKHRTRSGAKRDALCDVVGDPCYPIVRLARDGAAVAVIATEGDLRSVGALVVSFDDDGRLTGVEKASRAWPVDEESLLELRATVDKELLAFELLVRDALLPFAKVVGRAPVFLEGAREQVRNHETNLGDLSADAVLRAAHASDKGVVAALRNGGGIRASIPGPDVTLLDVHTALRFDSAVVVTELSHRELWRTVEAALIGAGNNGNGRGNFPQVSAGVELVYRTGGADQQQSMKEGKVDGVACDGTRVKRLVLHQGKTAIVVVDDGALPTPDARVSVATIDYLAHGGDGWFPGVAVKTAPTTLTEQSSFIALLADAPAVATSLKASARIKSVDESVSASCH
ncbi:MAG: 5'-nucleotidase C-terminal domain-containing protein [Deltaproteobacteria bacterium]|nr:5'-nucleotidase C-terminal domain-containing protein [Deltaproteobacteria bacterium]